MALRFANGIFEPLWRRDHIDHVQITAAETVGVEQRGAFYEPTGALRDMVPNHLFQLLSMVAMEPPNSFDAEDVRTEKAKLLEAIQPVRPERRRARPVHRRHAAGPTCPPTATSRTWPRTAHRDLHRAQAAIDNWRWAGVPFYLRTGKRMAAGRRRSSCTSARRPTRCSATRRWTSLTPNMVRCISADEGLTLPSAPSSPGRR